MKIGILTYHNNANYGAVLQAYALWATIKRLGHDVEIIDYRPDKSSRYYRKQIIRQIIKNIPQSKRRFFANLLRPRFIKNLLRDSCESVAIFVKHLKIRLFVANEIRLSAQKSHTRTGLKNFDLDYDVVISGSDQIWCMDTHLGFDPTYFFDFIDDAEKCRKISYGASFGNTNNLGIHEELIGNLIASFDAISVRDSNSVRLVQQDCSRTAVKVLDPTFLINYHEFNLEKKTQEKYILLYLETEPDWAQSEFIKLLANKKGLQIFSVGNRRKIADRCFISIDPEEWLRYFNNASYVVTNTYHGTIFSIIFQKYFTVFALKNKMNKVKDLLVALGLEKRLQTGQMEPDFVNEQISNIDYPNVTARLKNEISNSKTFLVEALEEKQKSFSIR